ncbi:MAG: tRNA (adenosine(37)-N6)-dimethylallyltransferase MiaA [Pseudomonadota bacterium]
MHQKRLAVVIAGPTAVGKTALAIDLAERFPCDLISVDSAMIYRGMDIGTAKPDAATLRRAPHALIDIRDPNQTYSAGEFTRDAAQALERAWDRGRLPILVGGTLLYVRALHGGLADLPAADASVRAAIDAAADRVGWPAMHAELGRVDAASAARIAPHDAQRIQRALEVYRLIGRPLSALQRDAKAATPDWRTLAFGLLPAQRHVLHERIERRFDAMLAEGFVDEVRALLERWALTAAAPSMRAVGYRQLARFVRGDEDFAAAAQAGKAATRQLAKRQSTWLRHDPLYTLCDPLTEPVFDQIATAIDAARQ